MASQFHAFTQEYPAITNRIITQVYISAAFDTANPPANPKFIPVLALWDTGASQSVVTAETAKQLGLVPAGRKFVHHAGGKEEVCTYVVNFGLPNQVGVQGVIVSECPEPEHKQFGAIIGMDIITMGDFSITNYKGRSVVSFRIPSVVKVDFVEESKQPQQAAVSGKISRNAKCPCNSGKKYKYCHGQTT